MSLKICNLGLFLGFKTYEIWPWDSIESVWWSRKELEEEERETDVDEEDQDDELLSGKPVLQQTMADIKDHLLKLANRKLAIYFNIKYK